MKFPNLIPNIINYPFTYESNLKLRIVDFVGAERFAQYIYEKVNDFVIRETNNRVKVKKVVLKENNKNSATYEY